MTVDTVVCAIEPVLRFSFDIMIKFLDRHFSNLNFCTDVDITALLTRFNNPCRDNGQKKCDANFHKIASHYSWRFLRHYYARIFTATELAYEFIPLVRLMHGLYSHGMPPVATVDDLIGRENELALLHDLLREAAHGRGRAVLIEGEPGIGKTALVRAAVAQAPEVGCEVYWGAGDELGQELPLLPFIDGLRVRQPSASARRTAIVRMLRGEITNDRGSDVATAMAEQLLALVTEQCATRPTVLVIDDLQWADPASITLWGRLARMASQMRLLLIATMRPVPQREDLLKVRRVVGDEARFQLSSLGEMAVADLVTALAGGKPDDDLLRLADGAAGNPLYLTELVAALDRSKSLTISNSGTAQLAVGVTSVSLVAAIGDRLGFVAGPVRDMLRAAALLGMDFTVTDLAIVLGRSVTDLIPAVDEASAVGVLTEFGDSLMFRHALIREALYNDMPSALRAAWHRDAGRALAAKGAPVDRVARQLLRATGRSNGSSERIDEEPLDEWVLDWLSNIADQLVSRAPNVAAELLTRAVDSVPVDSLRHGWLASRLADALYRIGDHAQAEHVAHRALEYANDPGLLVDLHWTLAQCGIMAGLSADSLATLDRALANPGISIRHRARLLVLSARTLSYVGEVRKAEQVVTDALTTASEVSDNWAMGWALHVLIMVTFAQGCFTDTLPLFDRALAVTQADPALTDLRLLLQINKAVALGSLDRYDEALAVARQARNLADEVGTALRLSQAHGALGQLLFRTGRWEDALAEVTLVPEDLKEPAGACCDLAMAAVISFHRGEIDVARRYLAATTPHAERIGQRLVGPLALAHSLERELTGAQSDALKALTDAINGNPEDLEEFEDLFADAVRIATQTGNLSTAKTLANEATAFAAESTMSHRQANALYCRGVLDQDPHRLMAAAARYEDASRPLLEAKALEAAAECFISRDDRAQARDAFTRAVDVYSKLGAAADVARVQATFRSHGIRRGPHSTHRKASSGWDSLTPMEEKVAAFVGEGLSNPEIADRMILSPRTVGTHVSHILKKLGVTSRADIARETALRSLATR